MGHSGFSWTHDTYAGLSMAFDGTRLAVRDGCFRDNSPFHLAIYSKDGLDYLAAYWNSVSQAAASSVIRLFWQEEPLVRWAETGP